MGKIVKPKKQAVKPKVLALNARHSGLILITLLPNFEKGEIL